MSFKQRERVMDYIEIGQREGATIVVGGTPPDDPALAGGAYLMPTVFDDVRNDMRIAAEEIFGPVVTVIPFDTEEEAIRLANATPYGLSGSIWSRDIKKALRTAKGVQAGVLSVNTNSSVHTEAPFGGYKMSGIGRELGHARARPVHRDQERLRRPELARRARRARPGRELAGPRRGREPRAARRADPASRAPRRLDGDDRRCRSRHPDAAARSTCGPPDPGGPRPAPRPPKERRARAADREGET